MQAVFLVVILLRIPSQNRKPNVLLSSLLVCLAGMLIEYVWIYSRAYQSFAYLLGVSLLLSTMLSPLYYLYAHTLLGDTPSRRSLLHFIPSVVGMVLLIPLLIEPIPTKIHNIEMSITVGLDYFPTYAILVMSFISLHMMAYFFNTYFLVEKYEGRVKEDSADSAVLTVTWLKRLSLYFCLFAALFYLSAIQYLMLPVEHDWMVTVLVVGVVVFIFHLTYSTYRQPDLFALFQPGTLPTLDTFEEKPKYQNTQLAPEQISHYRDQLLHTMSHKRPYLDGELRVAQLAESLNMPPHHLSQVINVAFEQSFFDFINQYRVSHAKTLLGQAGGRDSILDTALASGFNSKSSFNRVFKRETGMTPTEFLVELGKN